MIAACTHSGMSLALSFASVPVGTRCEEGGVPAVPEQGWCHRCAHQGCALDVAYGVAAASGATAPPGLCLLLPNAPPVCARRRAVLVGLYEEPEKPANAIDFIKMTLGAPSGVDVEALKAENEQLKSKCDDLEAKLAEAHAKLGAAA